MRRRLFLILFFAGFAGILSFLLVDLSAFLALIPAQPGIEIPVVTPALKILSLIQPTVLLAIAVLIGNLLAPKVGLSAPFAEALATRQPAGPALKPQLVPGVWGGVIGSASILLTGAAFRLALTDEMIQRTDKLGNLIPIPTRLLYGGITEELLMRWGLMTLFVWVAWRVFQRRAVKPTKGSFVAAILVSSLIFGMGHLPIALILLPSKVAFEMQTHLTFALSSSSHTSSAGTAASLGGAEVGSLTAGVDAAGPAVDAGSGLPVWLAATPELPPVSSSPPRSW